ncbi:MAG TPA: GNAT family N-acetyltransferase [Vicinamibacterales bacterium]|nr:GNAT family N-acetyltransferase [Vicinamibacterales bacterium]
MLIRPASASDRAFVIDTARRLSAFGPPPWRTAEEIVAGEVLTVGRFFEGQMPGATLLIAEGEPGTPAGFVFLESARDYFNGEPHGHVGILAVTREAEGTGAGSALLRAAEEWARARRFTRLTLNVFAGNTHAREVYERHGYRVETLKYVRVLGP